MDLVGLGAAAVGVGLAGLVVGVVLWRRGLRRALEREELAREIAAFNEARAAEPPKERPHR